MKILRATAIAGSTTNQNKGEKIMLFHADDSDFKEKVLDKSEEKILVDFYADWCGPCQMLAPAVEEISKTYTVCKVNVDESPETAAMFSIHSIPTLAVIENGQTKNISVGYMEKYEILEMLK